MANQLDANALQEELEGLWIGQRSESEGNIQQSNNADITTQLQESLRREEDLNLTLQIATGGGPDAA